jgi:hypothetical protein
MRVFTMLHRPAVLLALGLALSPLATAQLLAPPDPCQTFSVSHGEAGDANQIRAIIAELADAYRGSGRLPTRILRLVDPARFVSGYSEFERALQRDFDFLRNRELICRRGTLSIRGDLAVLDSRWEKFAFLGPGLERIEQRADVRIQFTRVPGPGDTTQWKITGLLGDFFGSSRPGQLVDLAITAFQVPATLPLNRPVAVTVEVQNLGVEPTPVPALVQVFDVTDPDRPIQVGAQQIPAGLGGPGRSVRLSIPVSSPAAGRREFLAIVDRDNRLPELNEENNRRTASGVVGAEGALVVLPNPNLVTFPVDQLTIRVTDPDQAGKRTVRVRLLHRLTSVDAGTASNATAEDEEELELRETRAPGVFELSQIPTGPFQCLTSPLQPRRLNGRLEVAGVDCGPLLSNGRATGRLTVRYTDPVDPLGRVNRVLTVTVTTRWEVL